MRRVVPGILLALLLVGVAPPALGADPVLGLRIDREGTALHLNVTSDRPATAVLEVSHDDRVLGRVNDRMANLTLQPGDNGFSVESLRADAVLSVSVTSGGARQNATVFPTWVGDSTSAKATAAAHASDVNEAMPRLLATRSGDLVLGWIEGHALTVEVSHDNGFTWGPPQTLTPADGPGGWAMAELDDGRVGFAYRAFGNATPWRLAQLDTATRAASSEDVPDAAGLAAYQYGSMTVLHDGSALVARLVGSDVSVDRLSQDGSGTNLASFVYGRGTSLHLGARGSTVAMLLFDVGTGSAPSLARSDDGGRTWTTPAEVSAVRSRDDIGDRLAGEPVVGDDGTIHAVFAAARNVTGYGSQDGWYVRLNSTGQVREARRVNGDDQDADTLAVAAGAGRVWLFPNIVNQRTRWQEAMGDGSSVALPYQWDESFQRPTSWTSSAVVMPNGNPVFLAEEMDDSGVELWTVAPFAPQTPVRSVGVLSAPVELRLANMTAPTDAVVGDDTTVTVELRNDWTQDVSASIAFLQDGKALNETNVTLGPLGNGTLSQSVHFGREGDVELRFVENGGTSLARTVHVSVPQTIPPLVSWSEVRAPATASVGQTIAVSADLSSRLVADLHANVTMYASGLADLVVPVDVAPGGSQTLTRQVAFDTPGPKLVGFTLPNGTGTNTTILVVAPQEAPPVATTPVAVTPTAVTAAAPDAPRVDVTVFPAVALVPPGGVVNVTVTLTNHGSALTLGLPRVAGTQDQVGASSEDAEGRALPTGVATPVHLLVRAGAQALPGTNLTLRFDLHDGSDDSLVVGVPVPVRVAAASPAPPTPPPGGGQGGGLSLAMVGLAAGGALVAGAGIVAFARTDAGRIAGAAATLPLYTRLVKQDVLQHEVRQGVHDHVARHPGLRFEELRQALGLANGVLVFHLRVLEREGYVSSHVEWTSRRYYVTGAKPPGPPEGDVAAQVTALLRQEPGLGPAEVARRLGVSRQLARYHLKAMERRGLVRSEGEGAAQGYRLGPATPK